MILSYLFDENMSVAWRPALLQLDPGIWAIRCGELGAPPFGTPDPDILTWCEAHGCILVTDNRSSMPAHLQQHLASGGHVPGIFISPAQVPDAALLDNLVLVANASLPDEFLDQIRYLPIE
jgi:hypothetical protein